MRENLIISTIISGKLHYTFIELLFIQMQNYILDCNSFMSSGKAICQNEKIQTFKDR